MHKFFDPVVFIATSILAVIANGEHINVYDNYIHDCYQKGVEIADGRYITSCGGLQPTRSRTTSSRYSARRRVPGGPSLGK